MRKCLQPEFKIKFEKEKLNQNVIVFVYLNAPIPVSGPSSSLFSDLKDARASWTALAINSSLIRLEGCSLKTEFINAIFAELRLASAFVGQFYTKMTNCCGSNEK